MHIDMIFTKHYPTKFSYHIRSDIFHLVIFAPISAASRECHDVILHYVLMLTVVLERELLQRL